MEKELYAICREINLHGENETVRIYDSYFLVDILIKWSEMAKDHDLLDGSWMITVYKVDPITDLHAKFARFDFVATDLFNYKEETEDPMYCCVCHQEREDVNEDDICPDCENPLTVIEVQDGLVTEVHNLDSWILLDWDSFEGGRCPYCLTDLILVDLPESGPVVCPYCNGQITGGDWTQEQQIAHARKLRSGRA